MENQRSQPELEFAREKLAVTVRKTLGSFLGTGLTAGRLRREDDIQPVAAGLSATALFSLVPLLMLVLKSRSPALIFLSCWGAVYLGLVVALTRRTSLAVIEIVELLLLPSISDECADYARKIMERKFSRRSRLTKSLVAAFMAILMSCLLLHQFVGIQLWVWSVGFFVLYFTAAQATLTAPFYTCFSLSLKEHSDILFALDPAASPALQGCRALGARILSYWFGVLILVLSVIGVPYLMKRPFSSAFHGASSASIEPFVSALIFVAGFFSFGFGSLVYLRFEADLRIAVERVRLATLLAAQKHVDALFSYERSLSQEDLLRLDRFKATSDFLSNSGYLKGVGKSIAIATAALLPPLASMAGAIFSYLKSR